MARQSQVTEVSQQVASQSWLRDTGHPGLRDTASFIRCNDMIWLIGSILRACLQIVVTLRSLVLTDLSSPQCQASRLKYVWCRLEEFYRNIYLRRWYSLWTNSFSPAHLTFDSFILSPDETEIWQRYSQLLFHWPKHRAARVTCHITQMTWHTVNTDTLLMGCWRIYTLVTRGADAK